MENAARNERFAEIIVGKGFAPGDEVAAALRETSVEAAGDNGRKPRNLIDMLLRTGVLTADQALEVRAAYDREQRRDAPAAGAPAADDAAATDRGDTTSGSDTRPAASDDTRLRVREATGFADDDTPGRGDTTTTRHIRSGRRGNGYDPATDPFIGRDIGGARLLARVGRGGMGAVYRAHHHGLAKDVAVKILPGQTADSVRIERFRREGRALAKLEHPHIVHVLTVGEEPDGTRYIVMQFIDGETLRKRLRRLGPFPPGDVLRIAREVAQALDYAHAAGIVHRDVKPDNIMLEPSGRVRITDFGLAREMKPSETATMPGRAVGTPYYMSPEQCSGKGVDARSDIYSLGATLYHIATGKRPFQGSTPLETALMHMRAPVTRPRLLRPDLPRAVDELIVRMLAKRPGERFQSCREVLTAIDDAQRRVSLAAGRGNGGPVQPPAGRVEEPTVVEIDTAPRNRSEPAPAFAAPLQPVSPPPLRRGRRLVVAALAALVVVGLTGIIISSGGTAQPPPGEGTGEIEPGPDPADVLRDDVAALLARRAFDEARAAVAEAEAGNGPGQVPPDTIAELGALITVHQQVARTTDGGEFQAALAYVRTVASDGRVTAAAAAELQSAIRESAAVYAQTRFDAARAAIPAARDAGRYAEALKQLRGVLPAGARELGLDELAGRVGRLRDLVIAAARRELTAIANRSDTGTGHGRYRARDRLRDLTERLGTDAGKLVAEVATALAAISAELARLASDRRAAYQEWCDTAATLARSFHATLAQRAPESASDAANLADVWAALLGNAEFAPVAPMIRRAVDEMRTVSRVFGWVEAGARRGEGGPVDMQSDDGGRVVGTLRRVDSRGIDVSTADGPQSLTWAEIGPGTLRRFAASGAGEEPLDRRAFQLFVVALGSQPGASESLPLPWSKRFDPPRARRTFAEAYASVAPGFEALAAVPLPPDAPVRAAAANTAIQQAQAAEIGCGPANLAQLRQTVLRSIDAAAPIRPDPALAAAARQILERADPYFLGTAAFAPAARDAPPVPSTLAVQHADPQALLATAQVALLDADPAAAVARAQVVVTEWAGDRRLIGRLFVARAHLILAHADLAGGDAAAARRNLQAALDADPAAEAAFNLLRELESAD
jgi:predicted Ser/Thr protein kinase